MPEPLPSGTRIAPFQPPEQPQVRAFILSVLEGEFGLAYRRQDLEHIAREYGPPGLFLVAWSGTEVVGTVAVRPIPEGPRAPFGMLRRMYVARTLRGRGLGHQLYQRLVDHAQREGWRGLYLDTDPAMLEARRFYLKRGFTPLDRPLVDPGAGHEGCLQYLWKWLGSEPL